MDCGEMELPDEVFSRPSSASSAEQDVAFSGGLGLLASRSGGARGGVAPAQALPAAYGDLSQDPDVLRFDRNRKKKACTGRHKKEANQKLISVRIEKHSDREKNKKKDKTQNKAYDGRHKKEENQKLIYERIQKHSDREKNKKEDMSQKKAEKKSQNVAENQIQNKAEKKIESKATSQNLNEVDGQRKLNSKERRALRRAQAFSTPAALPIMEDWEADLRSILNSRRKRKIVDDTPRPAKTSRVVTGLDESPDPDGVEVELYEEVTSSGSPRPRSRSSSTSSIEEVACVKRQPNVLAVVDLADSDDENEENGDKRSSSSSDSGEDNDATEDEEHEAASEADDDAPVEEEPKAASAANVDYWRPWGDLDKASPPADLALAMKLSSPCPLQTDLRRATLTPSDTNMAQFTVSQPNGLAGKRSSEVDAMRHRPALLPTPQLMHQVSPTPWAPGCLPSILMPMSQETWRLRGYPQPEGLLTGAMPQQPSLPKAENLWARFGGTWSREENCNLQALNAQALVQTGKTFPFNATLSQLSLNPQWQWEAPPLFREAGILPPTSYQIPATSSAGADRKHYLNPFAHAWDPAAADSLAKKGNR